MLPLWALLAAAARHVEITTSTFEHILLENNDELSIVAQDSTVFLSVQPYFFFGDLRIATSENLSFTAPRGARYRFSHTNVSVTFTNSANTVNLGVYVVPQQFAQPCQPLFTVHSKSATSAAVSGFDSVTTCVVFDFDAAPTVSSAVGDVVVLRESEGTIVEQRLDKTFVGRRLDERFIALVGLGQLELKTSQRYCDWNEVDAPFLWCSADKCESVEWQGVIVTKRQVKAYVWVAVYGLAALLVFVCGVSVCVPKRVEMSMMSTNRNTGMHLSSETLSMQIASPVSYTG